MKADIIPLAVCVFLGAAFIASVPFSVASGDHERLVLSCFGIFSCIMSGVLLRWVREDRERDRMIAAYAAPRRRMGSGFQRRMPDDAA